VVLPQLKPFVGAVWEGLSTNFAAYERDVIHAAESEERGYDSDGQAVTREIECETHAGR